MKNLITKLLNLPGIIVEDSQEIEGTLILSVKVEKKTAVCPRCGESSHHHENKRHLVRDLPVSDRQVIFRGNRRRFKCKNCRKP